MMLLRSRPADPIFRMKILLPKFVNNFHTSASIDLLFLLPPEILQSGKIMNNFPMAGLKKQEFRNPPFYFLMAEWENILFCPEYKLQRHILR